MKRFILKAVGFFIITISFIACDKLLDEKIYSELGSENYLSTQDGINTVLSGSYEFINPGAQSYCYKFFYSHISAGIGWGMGGVFEQTTAVPLHEFTWNSTQEHLVHWWDVYFKGIRNANIVLGHINNSYFPEKFIIEKTAESKALRAYFYNELYKMFGTVPIFTESNPADLKRARATEEEMKDRIESDLIEAIEGLLPDPDYGRVSKGGALGLLCKFYLNTKQWDKCVNIAREIINMNSYQLLEDYSQIYNIENKGHKEILWVVPQLTSPNSESSDIIALLAPPDYPVPSNQTVFAARNYIYDWFIDSFDEKDKRKDLLELEYKNNQGILIAGYGNDKSLYFKYPIDPNASGSSNGTDFIPIRYADILLSIAEALNEINGPNQESVNYVNQIRARAGVDNLTLSDFSNKESLRSHILNERLWEFYIEGMEREDLIRHEVFISKARERGINAKEHHVVFPIPQRELDSNPMMKQNSGY